MGTGFVVRRELFERIRKMTRRISSGMEDVDLFALAFGAQVGIVVCVPDARLVRPPAFQRSRAIQLGWSHAPEELEAFAKKYRLPAGPPRRSRHSSRLRMCALFGVRRWL